MRSLTIFRGSIVGLVDGDAETLVASPPPDDMRPRTVKGHLGLDAALLGLRHGRLEALQGAGLPEAQGRAKRSTGWRLWETKETREDERERGGQGKIKKPGWWRRREFRYKMRQNDFKCYSDSVFWDLKAFSKIYPTAYKTLNRYSSPTVIFPYLKGVYIKLSYVVMLPERLRSVCRRNAEGKEGAGTRSLGWVMGGCAGMRPDFVHLFQIRPYLV